MFDTPLPQRQASLLINTATGHVDEQTTTLLLLDSLLQLSKSQKMALTSQQAVAHIINYTDVLTSLAYDHAERQAINKSEPLKTLASKISDAIKGYYLPYKEAFERNIQDRMLSCFDHHYFSQAQHQFNLAGYCYDSIVRVELILDDDHWVVDVDNRVNKADPNYHNEFAYYLNGQYRPNFEEYDIRSKLASIITSLADYSSFHYAYSLLLNWLTYQPDLKNNIETIYELLVDESIYPNVSQEEAYSVAWECYRTSNIILTNTGDGAEADDAIVNTINDNFGTVSGEDDEAIDNIKNLIRFSAVYPPVHLITNLNRMFVPIEMPVPKSSKFNVDWVRPDSNTAQQ